MDKVKNHYNAIAAGVIAVGLGFVSKKALGLPSVGANGFQPAITSFVVVAASVMGAEYLMKKEAQHG